MGTRLHGLLKALPDHDAITDTLDYIIGAVYGLERAVNLGFKERPGTWDQTYRPFLTKYVLDIVSGRNINPLWVAGFHLNSAIQRLAASYDRVPKLLGATGGNARDRMKSVTGGGLPPKWDTVYEEVNFLKHEPEGRAKGRQVTLEVALDAADELLDLVERKAADLSARYSRTHP